MNQTALRRVSLVMRSFLATLLCVNQVRFAAVLTATLLCGVAMPQSDSAASIMKKRRPLLVGYFPQWGVYNEPQYLVKNLIAPGGAPLVDQIIYAQGFVTNLRCSVADPKADLNWKFSAAQSVDGVADSDEGSFHGDLHQVQLLKRRFPGLRILISLEGRAADFAEDAQPENREAFVRSCVDVFLKGNFAPDIHAPGIFDGIDVDWEYPHEADATNFEALLREFRRQMDGVRPGLTLSIAVGHGPRMYEGTNFGEICKLVDQVGLMMYDFTGPWNKTTGFLAPLLASPERKGGTVDRSVTEYLNAGVPAQKILMGVPFYGYGWRLVPEDENGLFQEGEAIHGDRPYSYIEGLMGESTVYRDPVSGAPWLFDGDNFWTYEDSLSIKKKAEYVLDHSLGGMMIWELGEDTPASTLLHAAYQGLHGPSVYPTVPVVSLGSGSGNPSERGGQTSQ